MKSLLSSKLIDIGSGKANTSGAVNWNEGDNDTVGATSTHSSALTTKYSNLSLHPSKSFFPPEKRNVNNPLFMKGTVSNPLALKSCKSAQANDEPPEPKMRDRNMRHKSDSSANINRSFTSGGQNYYSPFNTITITCLNTNIDTSVYCTKRQQVVIPIYQPFIKVDRKLPTKMENQILEVQKILRAAAEEGNLMIESRELLHMLHDNSQLIKK